MLQRFPRQFQRHALLRVEVVGLHLRQREEFGVESLDVAEVAAAGARRLHPLGDARLVEELHPAALGQVGDRVATLQQRLPGFLGCVHVPRESGGQPDDRDVGHVTGARPVFVVVSAFGFGFALDDPGRQQLDGRVLERHHRRECHSGEVLDVGGHRDRVTRGQPELDHRSGFVYPVGGLAGGVTHPVAQPGAHLGDGQVARSPRSSCRFLEVVVIHALSRCQSAASGKEFGEDVPPRRLPSM